MKVLAKRRDGSLSYCTAAEDSRGKRNCPHVGHQRQGETPAEFVERMNKEHINEYNSLPDQDYFIERIVQENIKAFNKEPDWEDVILNKIENPFVIGKDSDGSYEEASINSVDKEFKINEAGDPVTSLSMNITFRGENYNVDMGEVPTVQEDGTIIINGSKFRCLPVLSQFKSGIINYRDKTVVKQDNGHIAMVISPGSENVTIGGEDVSIEEAQNHLNGLPSNLTDFQKSCLDRIDPIAYERYPGLRSDIRGLRDSHTPDLPNDISYRKVLTYEDQVRFIIASQMRRMGVTFRTNLVKKKAAEDSGDPEKIKKTKDLPLFFQKNISENIKSNLLGRSNVQLADNLNPISALSQAHKISLTGPGGYNKDKAPVNLRFISSSHKGKIDSLDVSSGKNVGLTISLSNADLDKNGFIVASPKESFSGSDFIPYRNHNDANRAAMAVAHMKQACPIMGGEDPFPVGGESDKAWGSISGAKLGCNLRVAYIPYEGCHEDAVVISESAARKMKTKQSTGYTYKGNEDKGEAVVGKMVRCGETINGVQIKFNGIIKESTPKGFKVESEFKMGAGDKIAGRHGNKGVVSMVLPDNEMPHIKQSDGTYAHAEILMSPLSVTGRMNIGQVLETNKGDINKKTAVKLPSGNIVMNTAGEQFIMRLNHLADKKIQSYALETDAKRDIVGMRLGEMESLLLSSSNDKLELLQYLRYQESSDATNKLNSLLKSIGVSIES